MALPNSFSELYPNRFLKHDILQGKRATLTIKNIDVEELTGDKGKAEPKVVVSFIERPLELVLCKTNGHCVRRMFGSNPHDWIGHKITLFPSKTTFGRETVDCIRIWGSPEIEEDMPISVPQGRKKPVEMVMHAVKVTTATARPAIVPTPRAEMTADEKNARDGAALLGWVAEEIDAALKAKDGSWAELSAYISAEIDRLEAEGH